MPDKPRKRRRIQWPIVVFVTFLHVCAAYAVLEWWRGRYPRALVAVQASLVVFVGLSATAGGHRLFTHRAYEAAAPVHFVFMLGLMLGFTGSAMGWIRTHRTHHKYTDDDLDPHDARKGMFWAHFGWMFVERDPAIAKECARQDTRTLRFWQTHAFIDRLNMPLSAVANLVVPSLILWTLGVEVPFSAVATTTCLRIALGINMASSVNSLAHVPSGVGTRPWTQRIPAYDNLLVSLFTWGEGWHNFHHAYSKDYRASGHDNFLIFWNPAAALIRGLASLGLAWNLRVAVLDAEGRARPGAGDEKKVRYKALFRR
jgi:stearoyl-CoA desaturase (delta-9 desaturase)